MKACTRCGETKPLDDFHRTPRGRAYWCKSCLREYQREYRRRNPDVQRRAKKKWREANPDKVREEQRRWYHRNLEKAREYQRQWRLDHPEEYDARKRRAAEKRQAKGRDAFYRYGLTPEDVATIRAAQDDRCPLCERTLTPELRPHIDHDHNHELGAVRGILCGSCNARLGWYEPRRAAIEAYLAKPYVFVREPKAERIPKPLRPQQRATKTHCRFGHPRDGVRADGYLYCKTCAAEQQRARRRTVRS